VCMQQKRRATSSCFAPQKFHEGDGRALTTGCQRRWPPSSC
jgi:hypothetical protein